MSCPVHPTSLVRWRRRLGAEGVEKLLTETLSTAKREQALRESEIKRVNVDTTVQEEAVAFPTDARLYHKARRALVSTAKAAGIQLRQT
jgi:IS5 family transposase